MYTTSRKADYTGGATAAFVIILMLATVGGYVANIVKIALSLNDPITTMFVARCVGVAAGPVGAVLGYF